MSLLKRNSLPLCSCPHPKAKKKQARKISLLKTDVALFSHLYIILQHRTSEFLATRIILFLLHSLMVESCALEKQLISWTSRPRTMSIFPDSVDVKLLDGAAVMHLLPTTNIATFVRYADEVFVLHIIKQLQN